VLTPILATDDPYQAAADFVKAGWSLIFQTPRDSGDPARLRRPGRCPADARHLIAAVPARPKPRAQGRRVEFHLTVPSEDIEAVHDAHLRHAESVTDLAQQPWGERAFHAVLLGYRFLIAAERADQGEPPSDTSN
jgi:hypothetical protein